MKKLLTLAALFIPLLAFGQRGGAPTTPTMAAIIPDCTAVTGNCPVDNYVCMDSSDIINRCEVPGIWSTVGGAADADIETRSTSGAAGTAPVSDGASGLDMTDIATEAELTAHTADTTAVHGITDTSLLLDQSTSFAGDATGIYSNLQLGTDVVTATELDQSIAPTWTGDHIWSTATEVHFPEETESTSGWVEWDATVAGTSPPTASYRFIRGDADNTAAPHAHPNGEDDEELTFGYNILNAGGGRIDTSQHAFERTYEATWWDGTQESFEYNWDFTETDGTTNRVFITRCFTGSYCVANDTVWCVDDTDCAGVGGACFIDYAGTCSHTWDAFDNAGEPHFKVDKTGRLSFGRGVDSLVTRTDADGSANMMEMNHHISSDGDGSPGYDYVGFELETYYDATAAGFVNDMRGVKVSNKFTGSTADRDIVTGMVGVSANNYFSVTGDAGDNANVGAITGFQYSPTFSSASELDITDAYGLRLISWPSGATLGTDVNLSNSYGVYIGDLGGFASQSHAVFIEKQNNNQDDGLGNLTFEGGGIENGHIMLDSVNQAHLYFVDGDLTYRTWMGADGDLTTANETRGAPLHSPRGTDANWGTTIWGLGSNGTTSTGNEVCALARLDCEAVENSSVASGDLCTTEQGTDTGKFLALCKNTYDTLPN